MFIEKSYKNQEGTIFDIIVVPKSSKSEVVGYYDGALKLKIAKPARDNLANIEVIKSLSKFFKIRKSSIEIIAGKRNKRKKIFISESFAHNIFLEK